MADLRRLVHIGTFTTLQDKLDKWSSDYHINTTDQNVARGCEVIELCAKVQGQLFKILSQAAADGGLYGGASVLKNRLLPWLGQGFLATGGVVPADLIAENVAKDREIGDLQEKYERSITQLESDLRITQEEADTLKAELNNTKDESDRTNRASASDKMFADAEIRELRSNDLEDSLANYRYLARSSTPLAPDDITQRVRQQSLIARYNDMYTIDRIEAMATLSGYSDDHENNQRIVFSALQEAFHAAKLAFRQFKIKIRSNLALTHKGPETLEEAVQDYINRNTDLYDLPGLVTDVVRALNRNIYINLPAGVSYTVIQPFIREACKLAWGMSALAHPLDLSVAYGAELFDDHKYRRAYDSEFTAPLVNHHVWPCLLQGNHVITKGEAVTRRGASLSSPRRSRSPARSLTPSRALSPRPRSRSPSPRRAASPSGLRSTSRNRSFSPTRPYSSMSALNRY